MARLGQNVPLTAVNQREIRAKLATVEETWKMNPGEGATCLQLEGSRMGTMGLVLIGPRCITGREKSSWY